MPDGMSRVQASPVLNLPNVISFARLCAVPVAIWLVLHAEFRAAFALFAVAGLSDALDGWLARRFGGSALGALLDPVADKALLVSMFLTLAAIGMLPDWLVILVVFRDLLIVGGVLVLWLTSAPVRVRPLLLGKLNTALQLILVAAALLIAGFHLDLPYLLPVLIGAVTATTIASAAAYIIRTVR